MYNSKSSSLDGGLWTPIGFSILGQFLNAVVGREVITSLLLCVIDNVLYPKVNQDYS
jgi:hypothetical protein